MRKSAKDVESAMDEAISEQLRGATWRVYPHYELRELESGDVYVYAPSPEKLEFHRRINEELEKATHSASPPSSHFVARRKEILQQHEPRLYQPLIDKPDLLLEFASLVEAGPITAEVVLRWAEDYGVLGLDQPSGVAGMGNPRGGPAESVYNFGERALEANTVLRLYEAVTSPYGPHVETIKKHMTMPEVQQIHPWAKPKVTISEDESGQKATFIEESPLAMMPEVLKVASESLQEGAVGRRSPKEIGELAMDYVRETVRLRLKEEFYPRPYPQADGTDLSGWGFKSLYGAIMLQMRSLMDYTGKKRFCRAPGCFESISLENPEPYLDSSGEMVSPRKPRSDKIVCNKKCAKAYERHIKKRAGL